MMRSKKEINDFFPVVQNRTTVSLQPRIYAAEHSFVFHCLRAPSFLTRVCGGGVLCRMHGTAAAA
jgi:hypothetical protein